MLESFRFGMAERTRLKSGDIGYCIESDAPLRLLHINKSLYNTIEKLITGYNLYEILQDKTSLAQKKLIEILLSLVCKGYLVLNSVPSLTDKDEYPEISIIIPVKNRPKEIFECLDALTRLDYPKEKLEVVVVDDGSKDDTPDVIRSFNVRMLHSPDSQGASACRNIGAKEAQGEILAFLDSDCTTSSDWLKEIVPFFALVGVGAIGGFVESYFKSSPFDRYEAAFSPLNMGDRILFGTLSESTFYVPSCNLLVRKDIFLNMGGFKKGMHLGEDVDFCWRMRKGGHFLVYVPWGTVAHKHRSRLGSMLKRRFEYGTSESDLYMHHRDKRKHFGTPLYSGLSFILFSLAILTGNPSILLLCPLFLCIDFCTKSLRLKRIHKTISLKVLVLSVLKSTFSMYYFASFHLVRYYLQLFFLIGFIFSPFWVFCAIILALSSVVDYRVKKPDLFYPAFLFYYILEHSAYQSGVLTGCIKRRYFKCYLPLLSISGGKTHGNGIGKL